MDTKILNKELAHFEKVKAKLLETQRGKYALIKGEELIGTFTTMEEAYREGIRSFGKEPFLIRPVVEAQEYQRIPALHI